MTDTPTVPLPPPPHAGAVPMASLVLYLYADRIVPLAEVGKGGMKSFNSGRAVPTKDLAHHVLSVAIWDLQRLGAIRLEEFHEKKLGFVPSSGLRAKPGTTTPCSVAGYEASMLHALQADKHFNGRGSRVGQVMGSALPKAKDPDRVIIGAMVQQGVDLGYLVRGTAETENPKERVKHPTSPTVEPVPERIAGLAAAADQLVVEWSDFVNVPDGLWHRLSKEVAMGIHISLYSPPSDDSDW
jgi:hypothetical protein